MNSLMQVLFIIPDFVNKYASEANRSEYLQRAQIDPSNDFNFQMCKLADGLLSGNYSHKPVADTPGIPKGIRPLSFKTLMGRGHPEFSTKRQQDAHEYLMHLISLYEHCSRTDPVRTNPFEALKFQVEERIECAQSKYVKYTSRDEYCLSLPISKDLATNKTQVAEYELRKLAASAEGKRLDLADIVRPEINLVDCLRIFCERETIDDFYSTAVKAKGIAYKSAKLATFPDFLLIQARKFELGADWSPTKLDVSLQVPEVIDLAEFRGVGKKANEQELAEVVEGSAPEIHLNENVIVQLVDMGFSVDGARRAAYHTRSDNDPEAAVNWCMAHMEDSDFNSPFTMPSQKGQAKRPAMVFSEEAISMLTSLGLLYFFVDCGWLGREFLFCFQMNIWHDFYHINIL
jgi:ubiquitin carboxyl-terminal hydrolase 5/13